MSKYLEAFSESCDKFIDAKGQKKTDVLAVNVG